MATPPAAPNYSDLVDKTAAASQTATNTATLANRPNQTDAFGNTSTWTQDPTTGAWSQKTTLSGTNQGILDQQQGIQSGLIGQAAGTLGQPMDMSGIQGFGSADLGGGQFNMDPMGNSQAIQDATYKLLQPQREQARNMEIQRLKNQGLTEGSFAWDTALRRLDTGDTDAQLKALLAGTTEYGNQFQRGLQGNQQNFGQRRDQSDLATKLRGSQLDERAALRMQPVNELKGLMGASAFNKPEFAQFGSAGTAGSPDYLNAGAMQFKDELGGWNAQQAARDRNISAGFDIFGNIINAPPGTAGNDIYNQISGWFGG